MFYILRALSSLHSANYVIIVTEQEVVYIEVPLFMNFNKVGKRDADYTLLAALPGIQRKVEYLCGFFLRQPMRQAKLLQMVAKQLNINSIIFHGRFSATERSVHSSPFRRRPALVLSTSTLYQIDFSRFFGHVDEHLTSTSIKFFVMMSRRNGMLCFEALSISEKCTKKDRGRFALGLVD